GPRPLKDTCCGELPCTRVTSERCLLPKVVGRCRASFPRWWYNATSRTCQRFTYGGCGANLNNFLVEDECRVTCAVATDGENSNEIPQASQSVVQSADEPCTAPRLTGPCRAAFPRWYYDPAAGACKQFIYGGCKGNKNNYLREELCLRQCSGATGEELLGAPREAGAAPRHEAGFRGGRLAGGALDWLARPWGLLFAWGTGLGPRLAADSGGQAGKGPSRAQPISTRFSLLQGVLRGPSQAFTPAEVSGTPALSATWSGWDPLGQQAGCGRVRLTPGLRVGTWAELCPGSSWDLPSPWGPCCSAWACAGRGWGPRTQSRSLHSEAAACSWLCLLGTRPRLRILRLTWPSSPHSGGPGRAAGHPRCCPAGLRGCLLRLAVQEEPGAVPERALEPAGRQGVSDEQHLHAVRPGGRPVGCPCSTGPRPCAQQSDWSRLCRNIPGS
uniref:BPTI/Kunitz inhibitor domain-containing protein n=1 Tax=Gopherus agassizii TaxID=38772 RepID=A0A452IFK0_9SAUR